MTKEEVEKTINKVANKLAYKFSFGSFTPEDIKQEAWIFALSGLESYKPTLPLENFLTVHIKNRLCNFKRKHYRRIDKPCLNCPVKAYLKSSDSCKIFDNKMECELFCRWETNNTKKENIAKASGGDTYESANHLDPIDSLFHKGIIEKIDRAISVQLRHLWLKLKGGGKLYKEEHELLRNEIVYILEQEGIDPECL